LDKSAAGEKAAAMARQHPENYVMKPQREGGGKFTKHLHVLMYPSLSILLPY
jgi:hypothetical protein